MMTDTQPMTPATPWAAAVVLAALLSLVPAPAAAQCPGDCDGDNRVAINELIVGVNIALGSQPISTCPAFDINGDGSVSIAELILAVNSALNGCSAMSPTPTATPTATPTGDGEPCPVTPTPTIPPLCGNGVPDQAAGETCDDGNTLDGDACPSNCRIESCGEVGGRFTVDILWTTDNPALLLTGAGYFLNYPDGVVSLPGFSAEPSVNARFSSNDFSVTANDLEYGVQTLLIENSGSGVGPGTLTTIEFDRCGTTAPPTACDFSCTITGASDPNFNEVGDEVDCQVVVR
jgi:cysteine-rich repeat protein